jgi:hypothetical protein
LYGSRRRAGGQQVVWLPQRGYHALWKRSIDTMQQGQPMLRMGV